MNDNDVFNFLKGFANKRIETKKEVIELYIKGLINKDEYFRRMDMAKE